MARYTVRVIIAEWGETLDSIAQRYHLSSWMDLYASPCNDTFRLKRPNPSLIQPGDRITIPPDGRAASIRVSGSFKTFAGISTPFWPAC